MPDHNQHLSSNPFLNSNPRLNSNPCMNPNHRLNSNQCLNSNLFLNSNIRLNSNLPPCIGDLSRQALFLRNPHLGWDTWWEVDPHSVDRG